ncbi:MAG: carbon-nitrogen hydrolase family protein [Planctomycetota bacterium]
MPSKNRLAHVVTVSQDRIPRDSKETLIRETLAILDEAAGRKPDIVCLPETFPGYEVEPVPGPTLERVAAWARAHRAYVVAPLHTLAEGVHYNSAVLIDRSGRVQGRYDKIHPTEREISDMGVVPGPLSAPVFETDFARIGLQICFDVNWTDTWARLKQQGAEIVFYSSAYPAHRNLSLLACANEVYVASATKEQPSAIYDITGDVIARTSLEHRWAYAALCLGKRLFEWDFHEKKVGAIEKKYGRRLEIRSYEAEGWFTLASFDPELAVEEVIQEFELTPLREYIRRAGAAQDRARP